MKYNCPVLVVTDMDKTVEFYKKLLGLRVTTDFGANKTLTGGLALQTIETYKDFIGTLAATALRFILKKTILTNLRRN